MKSKNKILFIGYFLLFITAIVVFLNYGNRGNVTINNNDFRQAPAVNLLKDNRPAPTATATASHENKLLNEVSPDTALAPANPTINKELIANFNKEDTLEESGNIGDSLNPDWWLSSGAYFYSANGVGSTILGSLPATDPWRARFLISNPLDTDNGARPQNIFRLVQRQSWLNFRQEVYYKIIENNFSQSPNRNESNGLLLFNRYQDAFNLYYTGIRVDGYATIKKKIKGTYYTLAYKALGKPSPYDRNSNPSQLPKNIWIGLRSIVRDNDDGTVNIKLYTDVGKTGNWLLAAEAVDDGKSYGGATISSPGQAGLRTDFMDIQFKDYKITEF